MSNAPIEKSTWKVETEIAPVHLEEVLNTLAENGYQVHSLHLRSTVGTDDEEPYVYDVAAFDPTQIMKKQAEDMQAQMNALMSSMSPPKV